MNNLVHASEVTLKAKRISVRPHPDAALVECWTVEASVGEEIVGIGVSSQLVGALVRAAVDWLGVPPLTG